MCIRLKTSKSEAGLCTVHPVTAKQINNPAECDWMKAGSLKQSPATAHHCPVTFGAMSCLLRELTPDSVSSLISFHETVGLFYTCRIISNWSACFSGCDYINLAFSVDELRWFIGVKSRPSTEIRGWIFTRVKSQHNTGLVQTNPPALGQTEMSLSVCSYLPLFASSVCIQSICTLRHCFSVSLFSSHLFHFHFLWMQTRGIYLRLKAIYQRHVSVFVNNL